MALLTDDQVFYCSLPLFADAKARDAETRVARYLRANLVDRRRNGTYQILVNYNFPTDEGVKRNLEVDLLLISRRGIFLIEVKNWGGEVKAYDDDWLHRGETRHNPVYVIHQKAQKLKEILFDPYKGLARTIQNVGVASVVVLANNRIRFEDHRSRTSRLDDMSIQRIDGELASIFETTRLITNRAELEDEEIVRIREELFRRHAPPEPMVHHYQLVEQIGSGKLYDAFKARNTDLPGTPPMRIKRYILSEFDQEESTIEKFRRSAHAGAYMNHPNILAMRSFFRDYDRDDIFYEVTDWLHEAEWLSNRTEAIPFEEQLQIIDALCSALDYAHNVESEAFDGGIIHRNLGPGAVIYKNTHKKMTIQLTDFDYAKLARADTFNLGTVIDKVASQNVCVAPEVVMNPAKARPSADVFSLGALWFWMASLPTKVTETPKPEDVDTKLAMLPGGARDMIKQLLEWVPEKRPQTMEEVKTLFQVINKKNADA